MEGGCIITFTSGVVTCDVREASVLTKVGGMRTTCFDLFWCIAMYQTSLWDLGNNGIIKMSQLQNESKINFWFEIQTNHLPLKSRREKERERERERELH